MPGNWWQQIASSLSGSSKRARTPTVIGIEAVECGAVSLSSILAYYGCWVPLEELRVETGVSRDGANARNILVAARVYGLNASGERCTAEEVLEKKLPAIAFWNRNHFLVVQGETRKGVHLMDPARGQICVSREEFKQHFSEILLVFEPTDTLKKRPPPPGILQMLLPRLAGSGDAVAMIAIATLLLVVPALVVPAILSSFIDDVIGRDFQSWLFPLVCAIFSIAIVNAVLDGLRCLYIARLEIKLSVALSAELVWRVLRLPPAFFSQRYVGDVSARVQACSRVAGLLSGPIALNAIHLLTTGVYGVAMFLLAWPLALISLMSALLNALAYKAAAGQLYDLNMNLVTKSAKLRGAGMNGLRAMETLKASGTEQAFFRVWAGYQTNSVVGRQQLGRVSLLLGISSTVISLFTRVLVLGVGAWRILDGEMSAGSLVAFQFLMGQFEGPIVSLVGFGAQLQHAKGDLARIDDVLRAEIDLATKVPQRDVDAPATKLAGSIQLKGISYRFDSLSPNLIENLNLDVKPGQRIALVGPSGCGKTTIGKLIAGLYQPSAGEVLFDGKPRTEIARETFTSSVAVVDQDIFLFSGSVSENISLWDPTISSAAIVEAARDASVDEMISAKAGGYSALVSEGGSNLSGGQRQRIEIARALVRHPTICILDEATAALDPHTEKIIDRNLRRRGCTCIIIAHRLSTIRDCDEIIVLEKGKVVERGAHENLMDLGGTYAGLVNRQ